MSSRTRRNAISSTLQAAITTASGFVYFGFLMRTLGPAAMGSWLSWMALGMLACLADLGMREALVRGVAISAHAHDDDSSARQIDTAILSVAASMAAALGVALWVVPMFLRGSAGWDHDPAIVWGICAVIWVQRVSDVHAAALEGLQRFDLVARNNLLAAAIGLASGFLLVPRFGISCAAVGLVVQYGLAGVGHAIALRREIPQRGWVAHRWDAAVALSQARYGLSIQGMVATFVVIESGVKLTLAQTGAPSLVAFFDLAFRTGRGLRTLVVAGNRALLPRLAQAHATADSAAVSPDDAAASGLELSRLYVKSSALLTLVALPIYALAGASAAAVSFVVRGSVDPTFIVVLLLVLPGWLAFCMVDPVLNHQMGAGRLRSVLVAHGMMLALLVPLSCLALAFGGRGLIGGLGVVAAASASIAAACVWLATRHHHEQGFRWSAFAPVKTMGVACILAATASASALLPQTLPAAALAWAAVCITCVGVVRWLPGWQILRRSPVAPPSAAANGTIRVLVLHSSASHYGSDNALAAVLERLVPPGRAPAIEALVVLPHDGPLAARLRAAGIEVQLRPLAVLHRTLSPIFWLRAAASLWFQSRALTRQVRERGIQLVHSNTSHVLNGALVARWAGVPHLWHVRELNVWRGRLGRTVASVVARADGVAFVSAAVRDAFEKALGRAVSCGCVLYDGIRPDAFLHAARDATLRRSWGCDDGHFVIGLVGRVTAMKGQLPFVEAAALMHRDVPDARFVVVGEALTPHDREYEERCRRLARERGVADAICFAGSSRDVPRVMASLDALVLATTQGEPWGLVVLEGMAAALPVVASAAGGPLEMLRDGEGRLIAPNDPAAMASALRHLARDRGAACRMGKQARDGLLTRFTLDATVEQVALLYRRLSSARG